MIPPVYVGRGAAVTHNHAVTFGSAASSGNVSLGNEETDQVQATYHVNLDGTKVHGAVVAGGTITAKNQASAKSIKTQGNINLHSARVQDSVEGASIEANRAEMGRVTGSELNLKQSTVHGDAVATYTIKADDTTVEGTVKNSAAYSISLRNSRVGQEVQSLGNLKLVGTTVAGLAAGSDVTAEGSQVGRITSSQLELSDTPVMGDVTATYSIKANNSPIRGDVSNSAAYSIVLKDSPVSGSVDTTGNVTLKNSKVEGKVTGANVTADKSGMAGVKASELELIDSPVLGDAESTYSIKATRSPISGRVSNNAAYSITLVESPVQKDVTTTGNVRLTQSDVEGAVTGSDVTVKDSTVGPIKASQVELENAPVKGSVQATYTIKASHSPIAGDVSNDAAYSINLIHSPVRGRVVTTGRVVVDHSNVAGAVTGADVKVQSSETGNLEASSLELNRAKVNGDTVTIYGINATETVFDGKVSNSAAYSIRLTKVKANQGIESPGDVYLRNSEVDGQVSANMVKANDCKQIGSIQAKSSVDLNNSQIVGPVSVAGHGDINSSRLNDTLTCQPGFALELVDPEEKDPAKKQAKIVAVPLVIRGDASVQDIVVKAASYPTEEEIKDFLNINRPRPMWEDLRPAKKKRWSFRSLLEKLRILKPKQPVVVEKPVTEEKVAPGENRLNLEKPPQLIEVKDQAVVNGTIQFESNKGQVVVHPGAKLLAEVVGGEVKYLTSAVE